MQGFPNQRLASPTPQATPSAQAVGQMLVQRGQMGSPADAMGGGMPAYPQGGEMASAGAMGGGMADPMGDEMGGGMEMADPMGGGGMAPSPMAATMIARTKNLGMEGDWDPATEHSPSSTRTALDAAVRQKLGQVKGSEMRVTPVNVRADLTRLGVPPLEIQMMEQSGQIGDTHQSQMGGGI